MKILNLKYKGLILCIASFIASFIATTLLVLAAYNKNLALVIISIVGYFICFSCIVAGVILIYKGTRKDV